MEPSSIVIVGGGSMGGAIARRWRSALANTPITLVEPDALKREGFAREGFTVAASLTDIRHAPAVLLLAVKPQSLSVVEAEVRRLCSGGQTLLLSILAGTGYERLQALSAQAARLMPNTPASIGEGLTSVYAPELSPANRAILETLLAPLGQTMPLHDEALMHAITAVSGSGPAYLFAFMEAMMVAAQSLGLSEAEARASVTQTMRGAALLADQAAGDVSRLRREVTSPAGTTAAALAVFEAKHLQQAVMEALRAAATRSQELA